MDSQIAAQLVRMKEDWNRRAAENACWYINTLRLDQTEEEFDRSGVEGVAQWILPELELLTQHVDPKTLRFLEIGCGIGRMTRPLAGIFGEVAATDVSGEMIARARERLADLGHVHFTETSGADVGPLPADYFDIVYSIFVFQHVPTKEAIRSTLVDAWRVLRPGGLLRFQTNGVTTESFRVLEKNTWVGETFTEAEVRELARELGARVVSIYGADTMYCFSTLRKPAADEAPSPASPRIVHHGRADDPAIQEIPAAGNDAWLSLVVDGVDHRQADTNTIRVEIGGVPVVPRYAGQIRPHFRHYLPAECATMLYLEAAIPADLPPGPAVVRLIWTPEVVSPPRMVEIVEPLPATTTMISFRNVVDYGTDIEIEGPKSAVTIFVVGLDRSATIDNVRLRLAGRELAPGYVGYDASVASYKVDLQLPEGPGALNPGRHLCQILFKGVASTPLEIELKERATQ
jgi:ubiquinone/menaquinone biosynthesis C-methylase UbiE